MNYKMILSTIGKVLLIEAFLMLFPILIGIIYQENNFTDFLYPLSGLAVVGCLLNLIKPTNKSILAKEGFVIVALCWITLSLAGAVPFVISGEIPNYVDAFFETVSGFTTTGASVLSDVGVMSKAGMFWRIFTHFLGGMGVLVFVLAILPENASGGMYIYKAESPGPSSSKIFGKIKSTARLLYAIYIALTLILFVMLLFSGIGVYDSLLTAFSTAGTGGFGIRNGSIAYYGSNYVEIVVAVFMFLFGINFNIYYLILIGYFTKAIKSEELRTYFIIVILSTVIIAVNILSLCDNFGTALKLSFFQVASFISTTGFSTAEFESWGTLSKAILLFLTIVGACGGSTGGGMKVARLSIIVKSGGTDIRRMISQREVVTLKYEGKTVPEEIETGARAYFLIWSLIVVLAVFILSFDKFDLFTDISAVIACIGNVGPGLTKAIGAMGSYGGFSALSKIVLSAVMLLGRLEIFPIIILFAPRTWRKG